MRFQTQVRAAAILVCALSPLEAAATLFLNADGLTVYDTVNNVTWLANANLPAINRFTLPVCTGDSIDTKACVNASGSMSYQAAAAWVAAMNAANYLGHSNWQIPTTPADDSGCGRTGPTGGNFGFGCSASAFGSLYYNALGLKAPNTAVPIPNEPTGPFNNFQPYLYWSQTSAGQAGYASFSFGNGFQGANTAPNLLYVLPTIPGKLPGTPPIVSNGLQVNPGGQTVYDPVTNVTWLANANLAATNAFGLPACKTPTNPALCVDQDGSMTWDSASQFIVNMNAANYLAQKNWQMPPIDPNCNVSYSCDQTSAVNPFGELYYNQLGLMPGTPAVAVPDIAVGPFNNIQPYLYWTCGAAAIQNPCDAAGPAPGFEWSFSWGSGFEGTDVLKNDLYVTAYFVGTRTSAPGPEIAEVANAEGESPTIAPNTWLEIKGVNLAPAGDTRIWQGSDFVGDQMPTKLDGVSATVNGKSAYVYYVSPTQVNVLTAPDAISGPVQVVVNNAGAATTAFAAQAQSISPSFFVFNGGPYIAAVDVNGGLIAPSTLFPGAAPARPGQTIMIYANGFGNTSVPVIPGSSKQSGTLSPVPVIQIGGVTAKVTYAGLVQQPGEFQFNVVIPSSLGNGDQPVTATYGGATTQFGALIPVHN